MEITYLKVYPKGTDEGKPIAGATVTFFHIIKIKEISLWKNERGGYYIKMPSRSYIDENKKKVYQTQVDLGNYIDVLRDIIVAEYERIVNGDQDSRKQMHSANAKRQSYEKQTEEDSSAIMASEEERCQPALAKKTKDEGVEEIPF